MAVAAFENRVRISYNDAKIERLNRTKYHPVHSGQASIEKEFKSRHSVGRVGNGKTDIIHEVRH